MSSVDTKWKKKIKRVNKEGLKNKDENIKTSRGEKDKAQTKMLDDMKMRIKNIQNKRNGFTKLPHLTDVVNDSDDKDETDKDGFKDGFKEGRRGGGGGGGKGVDLINGVSDKLFKDDEKKLDDKQMGFIEWFTNFYSQPHWRLGVTYIVFLITYLQFYHLNFKEDIIMNFPTSYTGEPTNVSTATADSYKIPRDWGSITENIWDSLSKTLGLWVGDDQYVDIKHNNFLKYMNHLARVDFGIFLRYIFIPAQVIVAITQNLIPNLNLILSKYTFPLVFTIMFATIFGTGYIGNINVIKNEREKEMKRERTDFINVIKTYYAIIPISYFVIVALIIIGAFSVDTLREMKSGDFFSAGAFGILGKTLFKLFALTMSLVLSGLAAIPLAIFAAMWILCPEGGGRQINWHKWSNAIRDNYLVPEWDVCAEDTWIEWCKWFVRKMWNNKIVISTFIIIDIIIKLYFGKGDLIEGREAINENITHKLLLFLTPALIIIILMGQKTTREKSLSSYIVAPFVAVYGYFNKSTQGSNISTHGSNISTQ